MLQRCGVEEETKRQREWTVQAPHRSACRREAQGLPESAHHGLVPGPAGGISDVGVRLMAESLKKLFGHTVLVDNKPGAAG